MLAETSHRVSENTSEAINQKIRRETIKRLQDIGTDKAKIHRRIYELDREWDIERAIQANASTLMLLGLSMSIRKHKAWLALPVLVSGFLFQHAIQGWCPPVPVLRRLGFRTQREIDNERMILIGRKDNIKDFMGDEDRVLSEIEYH